MSDLASNMRWGWRTVRPDFRSRNGYRWPWPGQWAEAEHVGDGLCVALDWQGAAIGGMSARNPILVVGWMPTDELGRYDRKVRIRRGYVADAWSAERILRRSPWAYLTGADLTRANLYGADLTGANLTRANLYGADLTRAYLTRADLTRADLTRADLTRADLTRADLTRADLYGANLGGANLAGANLAGANLVGAVAVPDKVAARLSPSGVHP